MAAGQDELWLPRLRLGHGPLVGRTRELALLAQCLEEARAGRLRVVLLAGEPGIGKSRLLDSFPPAALAQDVTVLRGAAEQAEGMPLYAPFLEALGDYVAIAPAPVLRDALGPGAALLAPLLPEIAARLGELPPAYPLPPEQERLRLYESVATLLRAIARPGPLVLLLDDLHWADAATCDLLVHVARRLHNTSCMIVGAYRDADAEDNPALTRTIDELHRRRVLVTVPLRPLAEEESRMLVAHLLQGDVAPEGSALLHRQSEGNPFFTEELLHALVEVQALVRHAGRWELRDVPRQLLPRGITGAIRLRVGRLAAEVVEVLRVAALAGRHFAVAPVAAALERDAEQVEEILLQAVRARLLQPELDGGYAFTHDKVREVLAAEMSVARRRRLHHAIGEALELQDGANVVDLAFHFVAAGDRERGVSYALAAGEQGLRALAPAEAARCFRSALELLEGSAGAVRRHRALLGLGDAAILDGDYRAAAESYRAAAEAALQSDDLPSAAADWRRLGRALWRQEMVAEARLAFQRALALLGSDDSREAAETLIDLVDLLAVGIGDHGEGLRYAERLLAMVERSGDEHLQAQAYRVVGTLTFRTRRLAEGQLLLERALELAQRQDDLVLAAETCAHLANLALSTANLARSWEFTRLRETFAVRCQDLFQLRHVDAWRAYLQSSQGDWRAAEELLDRAERLAVQLDSPEPLLFVHWLRGQMEYRRGRFDEATAVLRSVVETVRPLRSGALVWFLGGLGSALVEVGAGEEALATFAELENVIRARHEHSLEPGYALACLIFGYDRLGLPDRVVALYAALLPWSGLFDLVLFDRALAVAAARGGDSAAALRHFAHAEALARREQLRPELALTLLQRGRLERELDPRGRAGSGHSAIAEGLRLCEQLDMQELGRRVLGSIEGRDRPGGLTGRQVEVLRLVAQGLTNREIAAALVVSERTVANHLTAIFTRIGVDNRAGATAYALRQGLA